MLDVGVVGAGHLGKIHLRLLQASPLYNLVGFYDTNPEYTASITDEFGYAFYNNYDDLLDRVDVIDIVTPTLSHFDMAKVAL